MYIIVTGLQNIKSDVVNRRKVLISVAGGATGITLSPRIASAGSDDRVVIPTTKRGTEVVRRKEVPKKWWDYVSKVYLVIERLRSRYNLNNQKKPTPGVNGIGGIITDELIAGKKKKDAIVYISPDELKEEIPDAIDDVKIQVEEDDLKRSPKDCWTGDWSPVPGDVGLHDGAFETSTFTSAIRVERNGEYFMLTAAHPIYDSDCTIDAGTPVYQDGDKLGEINYDYYSSEDWALVDKSGNETNGFENKLAARYNEDVVGHATKEKIEWIGSEGTEIYQAGKSTCDTSGPITRHPNPFHADGCVDTDYAFKADPITKDGDSGGPFYNILDPGVEILGHLYGGESLGICAYHLHDSHGINFGT